MVAEYTIVFGREIEPIWFTSNSRLNQWEKIRRVKQARKIAWAKFHGCPRFDKARLEILVSNRTGRRFDPLNTADIVKPLIDGAVDAGILPDDDRDHLIETVFRAGTGKGKAQHEIVFTFKEFREGTE